MSYNLTCESCGGSNQLPEGKNSMFCAFCGNSIERKIITTNQESVTHVSNIISKPIIVDEKSSVFGKLKSINLSGRDIHNLSEIFNWFTDDELKKITKLDLRNNKIKDLENLSKFPKLIMANLNNNLISNIPLGSLPKLHFLSIENNLVKCLEESFFNSLLEFAYLELKLSGNPIKSENIKVPSNFEFHPDLKLTINTNLVGGNEFSDEYFKKVFKSYKEYIKETVQFDGKFAHFSMNECELNLKGVLDLMNSPNILITLDKNLGLFDLNGFIVNDSNENLGLYIESKPVNKSMVLGILSEKYWEIKDIIKLSNISNEIEGFVKKGSAHSKKTNVSKSKKYKPRLPYDGPIKIFASLVFLLIGIGALYFSDNENAFGFICVIASISYLVYSYNKYNWWS